MPPATGPLLIGIDVGTTAVKGAVFDMAGTALAARAVPYPLMRPAAGAVEQSAHDWTVAVDALLGDFAGAVDPAAVAVIGLTSQVNTHLFVDATGTPLGAALVWQDVRAAPDAARLDAAVTACERMAWWGAPMPIDSSHALARIARLERLHPATRARAAHVLLPKDHCLFHLTGELVSDPLSNIGLVGPDGAHVPALLALVPGAADLLPPLAPPDSVAGRVRAGLPFAGTPVATGTMDAWAGMLGCGAATEGGAMYLGGTSEILGIVSARVVPTPGVLVMPESLGIRLHVGPTQSGGASLEWCARLLGVTPAEVAALAASHDPARPCPLFLPHLDGERAPLWDATARGTFLGLDGATDRAAIARSTLEGVACSARWLLDALAGSAGARPRSMRAGGGGFRSDVWNRLRADTLDVVLERVAVTDPGTLGAAGLGAVAVGLHATVRDAFAELVRVDRTYEPDPAGAARQAERTMLFKDAYAAVRDVNARLCGATSA